MTKSPKFRLLIIALIAGGVALAINKSRRQPETAAWCDIKSMECYERLAGGAR